MSGLLRQLEEGTLAPELELDVLEAADASGSETLAVRATDYREARPEGDALAGYREALHGGDSRRGARIVYDHEAAQCIRCHVVRRRGGDVGPDLSTIGSHLSREQLLEALVAPSTRIAPGYGSVSVTLENGTIVTGLLREDDKDEIVVQTGDGDVHRIAKTDVANRTSAPSSMPPMGQILDKRALRDVVAFLVTLQEASDPSGR